MEKKGGGPQKRGGTLIRVHSFQLEVGGNFFLHKQARSRSDSKAFNSE